MTKSTITRERLEWLSQISCRDDIEDIGGDEIRELASMALAAMDSEPVAWLLTDLEFGHSVATRAGYTLNWYRSKGWDITPLYRHAQPASVAPVCTCPSGDGSLRWPCPVHPGNSPVIPDGWTGNDKANAALMMLDRIETADPVDDDRIDGIKRIVSELVAATQPQNAPQNIPEIIPGWIPVSERMPEDRTQVILWDAEIGEVTSGHYSHKTHTFYHCGDAIENEITHWMAPPAAPQEVSDA